ncbi:MAG TPA: tRNA pseudouridine(38-40) synthase TruA [Methanocorpusculum sp.]|nr:tRNA pseudouridine(38-40) synthase TruA [Methanocorpusculum sp.]
MKLALLIGYIGTNFSGSQYQPDKRTIEGEFIKAGISCGAWEDAKSASFRTAGRTDKGVSARKQLISVTVNNPDRFCEAINFYLPEDIWCHGYTKVDDDFNPRFHAGIRTYRYFYPHKLNIEKMNEAAKLFVGTHDFSGFSKMEIGRDPMRTVTKAEVFAGTDGYPVFEVSAKSFLWNMVRGMAGMLEPIGLELTSAEIIEKQLTSHIWRVHPATADGLVFWDTETDLSFKPMRQKKEVARNLFSSAERNRMVAFSMESLLDENPELLEDAILRNYSSFI